MRSLTAYKCDYCGYLFAEDDTHHEVECKRQYDRREFERLAFWAKVEKAEKDGIALALEPEHAETIKTLAGLPDTYWGNSYVRDYVSELLRLQLGVDLGSSHLTENILTKMIQAVIPDYVYG